MRASSILRVFLLMAALVASIASGAGQSTTLPAAAGLTAPAPTLEPPGEEQIRRAIRDLNHPSPARRREAVRRLADWGPLAFDSLAKVAAGPDLEPALLAHDLLEQMGEVLFVGGRVRLEADRTRIRWNEPINLTVHVENPTTGAVVVPWPAEPAPGASQPAADDAQQVAAMMDIADQLAVWGPGGEKVELRVDPIEQDSAVHRAVAVRAGDRPPSHAVAAGAAECLIVREFNRGWARYPLLAPGKYAVRFAYQPLWRDPAWVAQGFGRIESNAVAIEVTEGAPAELQNTGRQIELHLRREGNELLGELYGTWDRDIWINLNVGGRPETHARLEWLQLSSEDTLEPFQTGNDPADPQFNHDKVKIMSPGGKLVLVRVDAEEVIKRAREAAADPSRAPRVALRYTHMLAAPDLRRALREKGRRDSIPSCLFCGSAAADPILMLPDGRH